MADQPRDIGLEEARAKGVSIDHSEMPDGELRFRLKHADGTAYSRTEATARGGWQNSHYHSSVRETYIVQSGKMALAELVDGALKLRIFGPNEICTTKPNVSHNVYLYRNSVIHSVKHGEAGNSADWHANPALDAKTVHLDEAEIMRLDGK
jgi:mannose-6-phosphate isomerase-like protein (cupin superfamily)